ncbi:MAG: glycosyltransferase family 2 protein [Burkholderiales bacterium]|nr:glycosyltransferase family 2 protein [Burkholderiales bacterium]
MMMPLVSVIMPVYNAQLYLVQSIESILNQSYSNFELIIIDDCSTDNSWIILEKYAHYDARIKLFKNEVNKKLPTTLNRGISLATGKYIVRMDADDIAVSERLMRQVNFMENHSNIGVCGSKCSAFEDDINQSTRILEFAENPEIVKIKMYLFCCELAHPSVIMRSSLFKNDSLSYKELTNNAAEDWQLWIDMLDQGVTITNLNEVLLNYRESRVQLTQINNTNIEVSRRKILASGLTKLFKGDITPEIINTHLNLLLQPKGIGFIFKIIPYYRHLNRLKLANEKNRLFNIDVFNNFIAQYYLINKLKKKFL